MSANGGGKFRRISRAKREKLHLYSASLITSGSSASYMTTRMSRLSRFALFFLASVHLILFSICPVSSRIYHTKDAVVIEVDDLLGASSNLAVPSLSTRRSARSTFAGTAINPYSTGFYNHQKQPLQPNFISWWYPHLYKQLVSRNLLVQDGEPRNNTSHRATYFPESKQSVIAYGFGPSLQIQKTTPFDSSPDRIFGGVNSRIFPFMAGLRKNGDFVFCGGSLISPTKILTAAHCVDRLSVNEISSISVSLGMNTQGGFGPNEPSNDAALTRRVVRAVYHLEHNRKTKQFDIAILTIEPPVSYSDRVKPVCLPPASTTVDQFAGQNAAIFGWGRTKTNPNGWPNYLQAAQVKIITNSLCSQTGIAKLGFSITNQHTCAGEVGTSSCEDDDGGPMVLFPTSTDCYTQVGITSVYGTNCATKPDPASVYTNVAFFRDWIDQYATPQYFITIPTIQNLIANNNP